LTAATILSGSAVQVRRILNPMGTMDAIDFLLDKLRNTKNNAEFFDSMRRSSCVRHCGRRP
jgi:transcription termination factor Rho